MLCLCKRDKQHNALPRVGAWSAEADGATLQHTGLGTPRSWSISCDMGDIRKNLLIASVGKQCSRLLEDDTKTALQQTLKNKWINICLEWARMTKAKLVLPWRRGRGQGSPPLLLRMALIAVLEFGLEFSEPTGVTASCVHTACTWSRMVHENCVFSTYFLRVPSFQFIVQRAAQCKEEGSTPRKTSLTDVQCNQPIPLLKRPTHSNPVPERWPVHVIKEFGFSYRTQTKTTINATTISISSRKCRLHFHGSVPYDIMRHAKLESVVLSQMSSPSS